MTRVDEEERCARSAVRKIFVVVRTPSREPRTASHGLRAATDEVRLRDYPQLRRRIGAAACVAIPRKIHEVQRPSSTPTVQRQSVDVGKPSLSRRDTGPRNLFAAERVDERG